jgi:hypothetical protein
MGVGSELVSNVTAELRAVPVVVSSASASSFWDEGDRTSREPFG